MDFVNAHGQQTEFLGRSDYAGTYHSESYGLESASKQSEREKVLAFILSFIQDQKSSLKLLSLPGLDWTFERMVLAEHKLSQFIGLEHSYSAFMRSRRAIPGVSRGFGIINKVKSITSDQAELSDRSFQFGHGNYTYSRRSAREDGNRRGTRANRLLYMKADTYMTMLASDYGATMEEKKAFNYKFFSRNAVWLDFTSQFCNSVKTCLEYLPMCIEATTHEKPVVLTVMNARDSVSGVGNRIERILAVQPAFLYKDHWTYAGKNGTPMLTICGAII